MESARVTQSEFRLGDWTSPRLAQVEVALDQWVCDGAVPGLTEAMRYAVLDGGKRLRPLLVFAAHDAMLGGRVGLAPGERETYERSALRAACAVELIHAYSLVHDDMPCMDNDEMRRGKPTVHVKYGQALALLAGDALQALAFELLTPAEPEMQASTQARLCHLLSRAAGHHGMASGQAIDLASVGRQLDRDQLQQMHRLKTGSLLQASVMMGAACGPSQAVAQLALADYGACLGLAFQVVDDILDVTSDSLTLGKTAGKDAANDKPTYVSLLGLEGARQQVQGLLVQAQAALQRSGLTEVSALAGLATMVVNRKH